MAKLPMRQLPTRQTGMPRLPMARFFGAGKGGGYLLRSGVPVGDYNYLYPGDHVVEGQVFGAGIPPTAGGTLWGHGQLTNVCPWSEDFTKWSAGGGSSVSLYGGELPPGITTAYEVDVTTAGSAINLAVTALAGTWNSGMWIKAVDGDGSGLYAVNYYNGTHNYAQVEISEEWKFFPREIVTPTDILFLYVGDARGTATLKRAVVAGVLLTKTPYSLAPIYIPTSGAPVTIYTTAASPVATDLRGQTWACPIGSKLRSVLENRGILGLAFALRPALGQFRTAGNVNVIGRDADRGVGVDLIRVNVTTGAFEALDSAGNVAQSVQAYTPEQTHKIELCYSGAQMWLVVDDIAGAKATFSGTFDPGDNIKVGIGCEDVYKFESFYYRMAY